MSVATVEVLLVEFYLLVWDKKVVLPCVPLLFPNFCEHSPWLPRPALDRGNSQLPRTVKTDVRTTGVLQVPRSGVAVSVHLDAVLGWIPAVGHPGRGKTHQVGGKRCQ